MQTLIEYSSDALKSLRKEREWSIRKAAEESGVPFTSWADLEKGRTVPDVLRMRKIGQAFGVRFI